MPRGNLHQAVPGRMNARMMRTRMTLEIVSELYTKRMFESGNNIDVSIYSGSDEPASEPFRIGINGDTEDGPIGIPFHPGALGYYKEQGYL